MDIDSEHVHAGGLRTPLGVVEEALLRASDLIKIDFLDDNVGAGAGAGVNVGTSARANASARASAGPVSELAPAVEE